MPPRVPRGWLPAISPRTIGPRQGCCGAAAYFKKRIIVADVATDPVWADASRDLALQNGIHAAWSEPILTKDDQVRALFEGAPILRVDFNGHARSWMAVYSRPLSNDVVYRTAPALVGPWSDEARLFVAERKTQDGSWTYDALVQPDYSEEDGRIIYVTYSRPTGTFGSEVALVQATFE